MMRSLVVTVRTAAGADGDAFVAGLPEELRSCRIGGSYRFRFAPEEVSTARNLWRRIEAAGLAPTVTGQTKWTAADAGQGRFCVLSPPNRPEVDGPEILEREPCPQCGTVRYRLAETSRVAIGVALDGLPALFSTASGMLTLVSAAGLDELASGGLLTGAVTVPVDGQPYFLLSSDIDLGQPAGPQYRRRCPECDTPLAGATYFPIFRRPASAAHVTFRHNPGPAGLTVSEEFARAAGRLVGHPADATLAFVGWYPDDVELAAVPALDDDGGR